MISSATIKILRYIVTASTASFMAGIVTNEIMTKKAVKELNIFAHDQPDLPMIRLDDYNVSYNNVLSITNWLEDRDFCCIDYDILASSLEPGETVKLRFTADDKSQVTVKAYNAFNETKDVTDCLVSQITLPMLDYKSIIVGNVEVMNITRIQLRKDVVFPGGRVHYKFGHDYKSDKVKIVFDKEWLKMLGGYKNDK